MAELWNGCESPIARRLLLLVHVPVLAEATAALVVEDLRGC